VRRTPASLGDRLGELLTRQADLAAAAEDNPADDPWASVSIEQVQAEVTRLIDGQDDFTTRKAMLRVFVEQVRIESREVIYPTFRIPAEPVRQLVRVVVRGGIEPPTPGFSDRADVSKPPGFSVLRA
jgi:hypothetical protein